MPKHRSGWFRRAAKPVAAGVILVLAVGLAVVAFVHVQHPRDEEAFLSYVHESSAVGGRYDFEGVDDDFLIAEGDAACRWLQEQPLALYRRGGEWTMGSVLDRFTQESGLPSDAWDFGHQTMQANREVVAGLAWSFLCGASRELRETHNPFNKPPSD